MMIKICFVHFFKIFRFHISTLPQQDRFPKGNIQETEGEFSMGRQLQQAAAQRRRSQSFDGNEDREWRIFFLFFCFLVEKKKKKYCRPGSLCFNAADGIHLTSHVQISPPLQHRPIWRQFKCLELLLSNWYNTLHRSCRWHHGIWLVWIFIIAKRVLYLYYCWNCTKQQPLSQRMDNSDRSIHHKNEELEY